MRDIIVRTYLDEMRQVPFAYGANDCALFVAGYLARILDFDPAAEFRGRYLTQEEGLSLLGADGLEGKLRELLEGPLPRASARTGDIAARRLDLTEQLRVLELRARRAEKHGDHEQAAALRATVVEDGLCIGIVQGHRVWTPSDIGPVAEHLRDWKDIYRA